MRLKPRELHKNVLMVTKLRSLIKSTLEHSIRPSPSSWGWTMYIITHVLFWSWIAPWIGHLSSWIGHLWNRAWSLQSWQHASSTLTSLLTSSFWIPWLGFLDAGIQRSTLTASANICRIINEFWRFQFEK